MINLPLEVCDVLFDEKWSFLDLSSTSYLNVPFDVSRVVFVATANKVQNMPAPLLDRMEVIELPGYTPEEKLHIAMRHLIPRVLDQHGITNQHVEIPEVGIMGNHLFSALCWI